MRRILVFGVLTLIAAASPARAQYGAPFNPGFFTAPEYTSGALGAGAAMNATQQSQGCSTQPTGRGGYRPCVPEPTPTAAAPRR